MAYVVKLLLTSGSTWTVPDDWSSINTVECIGAGGAGSWTGTTGGNGGGGGAYSKTSNVSLVPGSTIQISIGIGGSGITQTGGTGVTLTNQPGGDTWFNSQTTVLAKGGSGGTIGSSGSGGLGGQASQGVGSIKYNGGSGAGTASPTVGYGAGGAAGPSGAGNSGGGQVGGSGDFGFGGAGGGDGGTGQPGREFVISNGSIGSGSGGGGGRGGDGGLYGGGGGGSNLTFSQPPSVQVGSRVAGSGANGLIYITYLSPSAPPPVGNYTFLTGSGSFVVTKDNWNSDNYNFIAAIGGGGGYFGGGGAFSLTSSVKLTIGRTVYYSAGSGGRYSSSQVFGGDSWVNIVEANAPPTNSNQGILAKGGLGSFGAGGSASAGIAGGVGSVKTSGGNGVNGGSSTRNSSGGAAGPNGNGLNADGTTGTGGAGDAGLGGAGGTTVSSLGKNGQEYIKFDGTFAGSGGGGGAAGGVAGDGGLYGGGGYVNGASGVIILFWITPAVVKLSVSNWLTQKFLPLDTTRGSLDWISRNYFNNPTKTTFAISQMFKKITYIQVLTGSGTWTVPATWNNNSNSIEGIGAGGAAIKTGQSPSTFYQSGGGGGYFKKNNINLTGYTSLNYTVASITVGSTTYAATAGTTSTGGTGINGDVNYSGGDGTANFGGVYGGGAAGPLGSGTSATRSSLGLAGKGTILVSTSGSYIKAGDGMTSETIPPNTYGGGATVFWNSNPTPAQPGVLVITWTQAIALPAATFQIFSGFDSGLTSFTNTVNALGGIIISDVLPTTGNGVRTNYTIKRPDNTAVSFRSNYTLRGSSPSRQTSGGVISIAPAFGPGYGQNPIASINSGIKFDFSGYTTGRGTGINALSFEVGDWGTCCQNPVSNIYMSFDGINAITLGSSNGSNNVYLTNGGAGVFVAAFNDTALYTQIYFWGDGIGEALYAGGTVRYAQV